MFDIGFWEIGLIGIVALLVIGPEQLPGVARTVGKWVGTAKRFVSNVQNDINNEVGKADELKYLLEEQTKLKAVHEILETKTPDENDRKPIPRKNKESADNITSINSSDKESSDSLSEEDRAQDTDQKND